MNDNSLLFNIGNLVEIDLNSFKNFILNDNKLFVMDVLVFCSENDIYIENISIEEEGIFKITEDNIDNILSFIYQIGNLWYIEDIIDTSDVSAEEKLLYTFCIISNKNIPDFLMKIPILFLDFVDNDDNSNNNDNFDNTNLEIYKNILSKMTNIVCQYINDDFSDVDLLDGKDLEDFNIDFDSVEETFDENEDMYY